MITLKYEVTCMGNLESKIIHTKTNHYWSYSNAVEDFLSTAYDDPLYTIGWLVPPLYFLKKHMMFSKTGEEVRITRGKDTYVHKILQH